MLYPENMAIAYAINELNKSETYKNGLGGKGLIVNIVTKKDSPSGDIIRQEKVIFYYVVTGQNEGT